MVVINGRPPLVDLELRLASKVPEMALTFMAANAKTYYRVEAIEGSEFIEIRRRCSAFGIATERWSNMIDHND